MPRRFAQTDLSPVARSELLRFEDEIRSLERGTTDPGDFQKFRLQNGVYGIRHATDRHMIRIRIPVGAITPEQLDTLGDLAGEYAPTRRIHLTTRQDIQIHSVLRRDLPSILRRISAAGLTTREAAGNVVRNVTACPFAGVAPGEAFDVTPYATAVASYFLRNPLTQDLPRKVKIAFEGCPVDHARTPIHDIGAVAATEGDRRGFRVYVGGGLGAAPRNADLLEPFTPAEWLIPTCEAVLRIFDRHGNRQNRNQARIKFLVKQWGIERFRAAVVAERHVLLSVRSGEVPVEFDASAEAPPSVTLPLEPIDTTPEYWRWRSTNIRPQKQGGYFIATVRCPFGDLLPDQARAAAEAARRYCGGRIRVTPEQNLVLRWVPETALPALHRDLAAAGLAHAGAGTIADITRCPGADTCNLAITRSRGLAEALSRIFDQDPLTLLPEVRELSLKISGCTNSCGQHHIADIGFYGASKKVEGHEAPHYLIMLGGGTAEGQAVFGKPVAQIPARRVPEAVRAILLHYHEQRLPGETFPTFVARVGIPALRTLVEPFRNVPPITEAPEFYEDLGTPNRPFVVEVGEGECAV